MLAPPLNLGLSTPGAICGIRFMRPPRSMRPRGVLRHRRRPPITPCVLFAHTALLEKHPDAVEPFLAVLKESGKERWPIQKALPLSRTETRAKTGVLERSEGRKRRYGATPLDETGAAEQQEVADTFPNSDFSPPQSTFATTSTKPRLENPQSRHGLLIKFHDNWIPTKCVMLGIFQKVRNNRNVVGL